MSQGADEAFPRQTPERAILVAAWQILHREFSMGVVTLEGIVEHGQIRLRSNARLPDGTKVYVVVPDIEIEQVARIASPRLARPEDLADFTLEVTELDSNASL